MQKKKVGTYEVYYLKKKPELDEGPFLKEERNLINAIAERLGRIAERKKTEENLHVSEHKYKTLVENIPQTIFLKDKNSTYISCNENYARDLNIKPYEITGKTDYDFYPKDLAEKYRGDDERIMIAGKIEYLEEKYIQKGKELWVHTEKVPIVEKTSGNITGILGIFWDITERKKAEEKLKHLNAELERSNRDFQEFTYTISHDLQEPLRKITAFGEFLVEDCGENLPEKGRQHLKRMKDAAIRMRERIQHLLSISRVETQKKEIVTVDTHQIIDKVLDDLSEQIKECKAEITVDKNLPAVKADPIQLSRVFQNLISNAMKFRLPDRSPHISISGQVENKQAVFSVTDNGIGIEQQFFEKIFGVFRRLHQQEEYEGAGVGLAVCKKIIQRHGGKIWVRSEHGKGLTFIFTLTAAQKNKGEIHE